MLAGLAMIGGAWSAEQDADDGRCLGDESSSEELRQSLSRTAVRAVREQLGAELGGCAWTELMRLEYHRPAEDYKGKAYPEQRETVLVMMPDAWCHCPSASEAMAKWAVREEERVAALSAVLPDKDEFGRDIEVPEVEEYRRRTAPAKQETAPSPEGEQSTSMDVDEKSESAEKDDDGEAESAAAGGDEDDEKEEGEIPKPPPKVPVVTDVPSSISRE